MQHQTGKHDTKQTISSLLPLSSSLFLSVTRLIFFFVLEIGLQETHGNLIREVLMIKLGSPSHPSNTFRREWWKQQKLQRRCCLHTTSNESQIKIWDPYPLLHSDREGTWSQSLRVPQICCPSFYYWFKTINELRTVKEKWKQALN